MENIIIEMIAWLIIKKFQWFDLIASVIFIIFASYSEVWSCLTQRLSVQTRNASDSFCYLLSSYSGSSSCSPASMILYSWLSWWCCSYAMIPQGWPRSKALISSLMLHTWTKKAFLLPKPQEGYYEHTYRLKYSIY